MKGWSASKPKYMRFLAQHCPDQQLVSSLLTNCLGFHVVTVLTKLDSPAKREWYADWVLGQSPKKAGLSSRYCLACLICRRCLPVFDAVLSRSKNETCRRGLARDRSGVALDRRSHRLGNSVFPIRTGLGIWDRFAIHREQARSYNFNCL